MDNRSDPSAILAHIKTLQHQKHIKPLGALPLPPIFFYALQLFVPLCCLKIKRIVLILYLPMYSLTRAGKGITIKFKRHTGNGDAAKNEIKPAETGGDFWR